MVNAQLVTLVRESAKPITRNEIFARCNSLGVNKTEITEHLRSLVEGARIYPWSRDRYWNENEIRFYLGEAKSMIRDKPLWKAVLVKQLAALGFESPKPFYDRVFLELKKDPEVHVWPAHGNLRGESLCLKPLNLGYYLDDIRKLYSAASKKLRATSLNEEEILEFITGNKHACNHLTKPPTQSPVSPPVAKTESDQDFQRDVSEHLIFCWNEVSNTDAREQLEMAMYNVGLSRFGQRDEQVNFNGIEHQSQGTLFPGDAAKIIEPGWILQRGPRKRILAKAIVLPN